MTELPVGGSNSFEDLIVWQQAMSVAEAIYRVTARFPGEEKYGLVVQLRRAAVSIPSNIAEGQGRNTRGEFAQFLGNAKGSLCEVQTQLVLAARLGFISPAELKEFQVNLDSVSRLLNGLLLSVRGEKSSAAAKSAPAS
jgi:four helix bundle protein